MENSTERGINGYWLKSLVSEMLFRKELRFPLINWYLYTFSLMLEGNSEAESGLVVTPMVVNEPAMLTCTSFLNYEKKRTQRNKFP
jgi:hypothetical protein